MTSLRSILVVAGLTLLAAGTADAALKPVASFGANPGGLAMYEYVPTGLQTGRPLVVVMHGCTQTAASMEAAGWNQLADQNKFAVVYVEQQTANNPVRCFNWAGEYGDTANLVRGQGENRSVMSMIDTAIASHGSDPGKVYIVGFSAGGAFAAVMLATWPERFAAGAIMSGVAYRCATTVNGAYSCQSPGVDRTAAQWGDLVRAAHAYTGPRPRLQIWHGANDGIVVPANHNELVEQWTDVLGTDATADETETIGGTTRTVYKAGTSVVVEAYRVASMTHAVAIGTDAAGPCPATTAAYFENRGICSTLRAAKFFGLDGTSAGGSDPDVAAPSVAIVSPSDGTEATGAVTVVVAAADNVAMGGVTLSVDGTLLGEPDTEAPYQFAWDATAAGAGTHTLVAVARDAAGNAATATVSITVPGPGDPGEPDPTDPDPSDPDAPNQDLPGCGLDAGGGAAHGSLAIALAILLVARRRRQSSGSSRAKSGWRGRPSMTSATQSGWSP